MSDDNQPPANVKIEGETSPCAARTNEGDELFRETYQKQTGMSPDQTTKPTTTGMPRGQDRRV